MNLSDGGQIENLGIYELLKRRCRWIIAVDADEDPEMTCGCLASVLRYARIELGITIDILERAKDCDVVVLASGDGDFDVLVQYVRERFSIDFEVYGVPQLTAGSLIAAATRFVPIDESLLLRSRPE